MAQNQRNNVVIFGGSSGVGLAVAKLVLIHLPHSNVIICSSNEDKLKRAAAEIKVSKPNVAILDTIVADLSDLRTQHDSVESVLKAATGRFNSLIDHIVWTAGDARTPILDNRSHDDLIRAQTVRIFGPMTLHTLAKTYMNNVRQSSITLTSGVLVYRPSKGRTRMTAVLGSLESTVKAMAVELAPIRVNGIVLGLIQTPLLDLYAPSGSNRAKELAEKTLCKTIGEPAEAAEAYLYSMRCAYVTGSMVNVEGGTFLAVT